MIHLIFQQWLQWGLGFAFLDHMTIYNSESKQILVNMLNMLLKSTIIPPYFFSNYTSDGIYAVWPESDELFHNASDFTLKRGPSLINSCLLSVATLQLNILPIYNSIFYWFSVQHVTSFIVQLFMNSRFSLYKFLAQPEH